MHYSCCHVLAGWSLAELIQAGRGTFSRGYLVSDLPDSSLLNPQVCFDVSSLSHIKEYKASL